MTETDRQFDAEIFQFGTLDLDLAAEEDADPPGDYPRGPFRIPLNCSSDIIRRLIERLQEL